jgi:hypothetical protein
LTAAISIEQARAAFTAVHAHGSIRAAVRATGISYGAMHKRYSRAVELALLDNDRPAIDVEPVVRGRVHALPRSEWALPAPGEVARYIFTCAQNNTHLFMPAWESLKALAEHYDARICVSTFTYDKASYGKMSVKRGKEDVQGELWYAPEIEPFILDESVVIAPGLIWCGEMNILPTAVRPLSGFESYTGRKSGIFPHVKFAMESIAAGKHEGTKFNYTTGTITQRNYIAKTAGLKAEFHHGYGALLVEVDSDGNWFCRQLNSDSDGAIYDLTLQAKEGLVTDGHRLEAITWGDIHVGTVPAEVEEMLWGGDYHGGFRSMIDALSPRYQFMHDVLDFRARNHHDRGNPHKAFEKHVAGKDDVGDELDGVTSFLTCTSYRDWCQTVVVDSNHDNAFMRWLREGDYKTDPRNAVLFLEAQARVYRAIAEHDKSFHLVAWAVRDCARGDDMLRRRAEDMTFLRADESFIVCPDAGGGIECGMHGDHGPNGARASLRGFAKMGRKSNTGHGHSAGIEDGAYRSGITGDLEQGYNIGPSSWSRSHVLTYRNGKRTVITCYQGKWRA